MSLNCEGPCLSHCYYKNSFLLLIIGIIIGYLIYKNICIQSKKKKL